MAAKDYSISFKIVELFPNDTPPPFVKLADYIYQMRNYSSVLVILDCTEQEASYLIEASNMVFVRTVKFQWLLLKEIDRVTNKAELLPPGVLGTRLKFDERNWVHDALTLLNHSILEWKRKQNCSCSCNEISHLQLYR